MHEPDGTRSEAAGTGRTRISRRRVSDSAAGLLCRLRGDGRAYPARGAALLERRSAGGLCHAGGGPAAFPGDGTHAQMMQRRAFLLSGCSLVIMPAFARAADARL